MSETFKEIVNFIRKIYNLPTGTVPLHAPVFQGNEEKYVKECIDSTYVSSVGSFVDLFETKIAEYTGAKKAVACINGTSALHLALKLVGVESGDEVLTQPLTFIATANAISYCGGQPVFLDVDINTLGLSPEKLGLWLKKNVILKKAENSKSKAYWKELNRYPENRDPQSYNLNTGRRISACVPMHTFGHPCKISEIVEICDNYNIPVVEDAAESLGSFYKKQHTGTFGKIGILSFNGNKIITTGGGGMLLIKDEGLAKYAKHLTTQAKLPHPWQFVHDTIGFNYRMPNINAALGLAQLEQLSDFLKLKRKIASKYNAFFKTLDPAISFIEEPIDSQSNYWLNCILLKNIVQRDNFLKYTYKSKVMTRPVWQLMNELPMFMQCQSDDLKNAREFSSRLVNIPSSVSNEANC